MEKSKIEELSKNGKTIREIARDLNVSYTTVRYWLNKFKIKTSGHIKSNKWNEEELREIISRSGCKSDVLRLMKISPKSSGNFQTLDRYIRKYNIDISCLKYNNDRGNRWVNKYDNDEIFCVNSKFSTKNLKKRIINENLIKYECEECHIVDVWNNKKLILHLDHINGINNDNRLENLRFLCPNCHSQTKTYCIGNKINVTKSNN